MAALCVNRQAKIADRARGHNIDLHEPTPRPVRSARQCHPSPVTWRLTGDEWRLQHHTGRPDGPSGRLV